MPASQPPTYMVVQPPTGSPVDRLGLALIKDPRDLIFFRTTAWMATCLLPVSALMFVPGVFRWWLAPLYLGYVMYFFIDRYILMLHATSHRPLYKREYLVLGHVVPVLLAPFFGQSPYTYYAHHMGMHHPENNMEDDLSSTLKYQRDSRIDFLKYWATFFFLGPFQLPIYFAKRRRWSMFRMFVLGEVGWFSLVALLLWLVPGPTFTVFVVPFLMIRFLMMSGNWGQHAFVCPDDPSNPFKNSATLINARHNRRCYNDGYHAVHHEKQVLHWSEMPLDFENHRDKYAKNDALVFDGIFGFQKIWWFLMTRQYQKLASHVVRFDGSKTDEEIVALLHRRLTPIAPGSTLTAK